jgi:hypothetical protein
MTRVHTAAPRAPADLRPPAISSPPFGSLAPAADSGSRYPQIPVTAWTPRQTEGWKQVS